MQNAAMSNLNPKQLMALNIVNVAQRNYCKAYYELEWAQRKLVKLEAYILTKNGRVAGIVDKNGLLQGHKLDSYDIFGDGHEKAIKEILEEERTAAAEKAAAEKAKRERNALAGLNLKNHQLTHEEIHLEVEERALVDYILSDKSGGGANGRRKAGGNPDVCTHPGEKELAIRAVVAMRTLEPEIAGGGRARAGRSSGQAKRKERVRVGPKGGRYVVRDGKKVYV